MRACSIQRMREQAGGVPPIGRKPIPKGELKVKVSVAVERQLLIDVKKKTSNVSELVNRLLEQWNEKN